LRQNDFSGHASRLEHPAFGEPSYAAFKGSPEFLSFCDSWVTGGLKPEETVFGASLLWCNCGYIRFSL
jgi:hypothetical protein